MTKTEEECSAIRAVLENFPYGLHGNQICEELKKRGIKLHDNQVNTRTVLMSDVCEEDDGCLCLVKFLEVAK